MIAPKHVTSKPKVNKAKKTRESKYDDIYDTPDSFYDSDNLVETSTDDDNEDRERDRRGPKCSAEGVLVTDFSAGSRAEVKVKVVCRYL